MRSCGRPARRRTPRSSSYSRRPRLRAQPSRWRRSRLRVSCSSCFFCLLVEFVEIRSRLNLHSLLSGLLTALRTLATQAMAIQTAYYSSQQERRLCGMRLSRRAKAWRKATCKPGAPWSATSVPWAVMSPGVCAVHFAWGPKDPRRGAVALPGQPRSDVHRLYRPQRSRR
jgi:hypothetical protein